MLPGSGFWCCSIRLSTASYTWNEQSWRQILMAVLCRSHQQTKTSHYCLFSSTNYELLQQTTRYQLCCFFLSATTDHLCGFSRGGTFVKGKLRTVLCLANVLSLLLYLRNALPVNIRRAPSVDSFKRLLKTYSFQISFPIAVWHYFLSF